MAKSIEENDPVEAYNPEDPQEDYSDVEIDLVLPSSRVQRLGWNKYSVDIAKS